MSFKCMPMGQDPITIHFIGAMTEDADLSMLRVPTSAKLEIELSQLTSINSIGIREFRNWAQGLKNADIKLVFAPKCFIDQVNMVPDLIPRHARVESFYVPYYSEASAEETRILFSLGKEYEVAGSEALVHWPVVNDSRGNVMEPDVVVDNYTRFLSK